MSQTKKYCEPLVAVWLRPSTTEPCICCKQVAEKPRGEHLKNDVFYLSRVSSCRKTQPDANSCCVVLCNFKQRQLDQISALSGSVFLRA